MYYSVYIVYSTMYYSGKARESQQLMVKSHEEELTNQTTELELLTQNYEQEKQVCLSVSVYFCLSVCLSIGGGRGGCASC